MSAKTHKAASKRLRVTPKGKIVHNKMGKDHLMTNKSPGQKRRLRKKSVISGRTAKRLAGFITSG